MRIAVTGASGFIGTELLAELADRGYDVIALTRRRPGCPDSFCCEWRETDYSEKSLTTALSDVDTVIHLAGVRGTSSNPTDYAVNEEITENVLKGILDAGVKRIVFASSISVYDDVSLIPWNEESPLKGRTMYGESKIRCERLIREYAYDCRDSEKEFDYAIVRIAQVLGLREKRRGMMNVFLDTARDGGEIKVIGKSTAKRQYIYVKDLVKIIALLVDNNVESYRNITVNVGMPEAHTNLEIAKIVNRVYGNMTPINYDDESPESIRSSFMDITLLREQIGYLPADMEEAIRDIRQVQNSRGNGS